jgi:TolB protein
VGPEDEAGGPPGGIIFVSDRSGAVSDTGVPLTDIFRVNADGTDMENLTEEPARIYRDLRLSPDGMKIAFESDRLSCFNIWAMNIQGTGSAQLTGQPGERCNEMPRWSRNGSQVAFTSSREPIERSWEAYVMDADGDDPHNVSDDGGLGEGGADWPHTWLPDGRLVFHHQKVGPPRTFTVDADGVGREPFLELQAGYAPGDDTFYHGARANLFVDPWSPGGTILAFASERTGNREVYVIHEDGSGLTNVTNDPATDRFDGWSPSGDWIAFESDRNGPWHIFAVNPDRGELWQVTDGSANDWNAIWVGGRE